MGFKHKFPLVLWGMVPRSSQESVSRARALGGVSGDSRFLLTLKCPNAQLLGAEQVSMSRYS